MKLELYKKDLQIFDRKEGELSDDLKIKFYEYVKSIFHEGVLAGFNKKDDYSEELPKTFFAGQKEITLKEMMNQFPEDYQETFYNFAQRMFNQGISRGKSEIGKNSAIKFSHYLISEQRKLILKRDVGDLEDILGDLSSEKKEKILGIVQRAVRNDLINDFEDYITKRYEQIQSDLTDE